jgi:FkbM family methyltransferase
MLNLNIGSGTEIEGRSCILVPEGVSGHAIYGPYVDLDSGQYIVEFNFRTAGDTTSVVGTEIIAVVDVASGYGHAVHAREEVPFSRLANSAISLRLLFEVGKERAFEFRVETTGRVALLIEEFCAFARIDKSSGEHASLLDDARFPNPAVGPVPFAFVENATELRRLYERGASVKIVDDNVVVSVNGVSFYARSFDDLRFIDEIFFRNAYNFVCSKDCCVIDIGMNIGLVSMRFAMKSTVKEVHSYEPFVDTYQRALANFRLNPEIAKKIVPNNFGLSDVDTKATILIADESDSGMFSLRSCPVGTAKEIVIRDASEVLKPIIHAATEKGRRIIAKIDCEGSEFAIFESFSRSDVFDQISAFMVEWHRVFPGKSERDLFESLMRHGFIVFDLSGSTGNGFFYAVKTDDANGRRSQ